MIEQRERPAPAQTAQIAGSSVNDSDARIVRVGLVQSTSVLGDEQVDPRDANLERALEQIADLAAQKVDLVVFGEMYLSGYRTDEWLHKWATRVDPPDRHVRALMQAARQYGIHLIMGVGTFGSFVPGDVYNSAVFIGPGGVIGTYRKTHVAARVGTKGVSQERSFYSPGRDIPVFDSALGRVGIHICYDISFPEVSRVQALLGAEVLINVSASTGGFEDYWDHAAYMRAVENASWYVACSVVGDQRGSRLFGGSRVIDPTGRTVALAKFDEEDVVVADIDLELARRTRARMHPFTVRQPGLYRAIADEQQEP